MSSKNKLKNQVVKSPPRTRRMAAKECSNLDNEHMAEVVVSGNVVKRQRGAVKPISDKNNTDTKKEKKKERSNSVTVVETKPTTSNATTRNMRERRRRSKSDDSENRMISKTKVLTQQTKISATKPKADTKVPPLTGKPFVETRKMVVISPTKTSRTAAKELSYLDKENMAEVVVSAHATKRRGAAKALQDKNDTVEDTKKEEKKERSNSVTVVETKSTTSDATTRNMRGRRRRSKSDDSENRIIKTKVPTQQTKIFATKTNAATNVTPLNSKPLIRTRKMAALKSSSQKTIPQILTTSNVTIRRKVVAANPLENKASTDSSDKQEVKGQMKTSTGNSSTDPVYKKKLDDNMNATVDSVFEFESNSQEITNTNDEPMKDIIEKLVRENKAVVKHKVVRKKGVTVPKGGVAKAKVTKERVSQGKVTKRIVTRSEAKVTNVKMTLSKLRDMHKSTESIRKTIEIAPGANIEQIVKPQGSTNLVDPINVSSDIETSYMQEDNAHLDDVEEIKETEEVPTIADVTNVVQIVDTENVASTSWCKPSNPPLRLRKTNKIHQKTSTKSITPQYQSTPVRKAANSVSSPWRVPVNELRRSSSNDLEFSKIDQIDVSIGNTTKNEAKTTDQKSEQLQQTDKAKGVSADIKNCFGFDCDDDDDGTIKDTVPKPIPKIRGSIPNINFSISETLNRLRANKYPIDKSKTKLIKPRIIQFQQPKTVTDKRIGNVDKVDDKQTDGDNKKKFLPKSNSFGKILINQTETSTQKPSTSKPKSSDDGPVLFDTNWPRQEDKKHRSYARVPQQKNKNIIMEDESEAEDVTHVQQPRRKRTKQNEEDPKFEEELRKFEEEFNSTCKEVEKYNLVMEVSV